MEDIKKGVLGKTDYMTTTSQARNKIINDENQTTIKGVGDKEFSVCQLFTFSSLPSPSDYIGSVYVSDIGLRGSYWRSDGVNWGIIGGSVVLAQGSDLSVSNGSTSEEELFSMLFPGGLIGNNGQIEVVSFWSGTNNANIKTTKIKLGSLTALNTTTLTNNTIYMPPPTRIWNKGSQNSQVCFAAANGNSTVATSTAATTGSVDTSLPTLFSFTGQKTNGSDTLTLSTYTITLVRP